MLAHRAGDALAACAGCHHITGIGHMVAEARLIRFQQISAEHVVAPALKCRLVCLNWVASAGSKEAASRKPIPRVRTALVASVMAEKMRLRPRVNVDAQAAAMAGIPWRVRRVIVAATLARAAFKASVMLRTSDAAAATAEAARLYPVERVSAPAIADNTAAKDCRMAWPCVTAPLQADATTPRR